MSQSRHSVLFALTVVVILIPFKAFTQLSFDSVALAKIKPRMESLVEHGKHYPYSDMPSETTLQEIVKSHSEQPLETAPGTNFQYSSQGIEVLGLIIERVTGMPYENFVAEHILKPLGMTDSFFRPTPEQCSRVAAVYQMGEDGLVPLEGDPCRPYTYPNPAGGLFSTAKDMLVFYEMMQQGGAYMNARILSNESVRAMTTPNISVPSVGLFSAFGLGFWVVGQEIDTRNLPLQSLGSFGHAGYFGTIGWANPEKELTGVFLVSYDPNIDFNRHLYVREAAEIFIAMVTSAILE